jgi:signal transduction histidine kinase
MSRHGGTIEAAPSDGGGTTMIVTLPLAANQAVTESPGTETTHTR